MINLVVNLSLLSIFVTATFYGYLTGFLRLFTATLVITSGAVLSLLFFQKFDVIPSNLDGSMLAISIFVIITLALSSLLGLIASKIHKRYLHKYTGRHQLTTVGEGEEVKPTHISLAPTLNRTFGATYQALLILCLLWALAFSFESGNLPVDEGVRKSSVITFAGRFTPSGFGDTLLFIENTFVQGGLGKYSYPTVEPTLDRVMPEDTEAYWATKHLHPSVPLIMGVDRCDGTNVRGTGILVSNNTVITNAHVVAGVRKVLVRFNNEKLLGDVIFFNAQDDIAVLRISKSRANPITLSEATPKLDDKGFIIGYPEGGPIDARGAVITRFIKLKSKDIYNKSSAEREVIEIKSIVRHGNSGGPLLNTDRELIGMVYAVNNETENQGFVIRLEEIKKALRGEGNNLPQQNQCISRQ